MILCITWKLFLLLASLVSLTQADSETSPRLPSIWSDGQDGGGKSDPDYRIRAEVQLAGSGKSFIMEEWASGVLDRFRLDMIDSRDGKRSTYLSYKDTNESFYYEPFQCKLVNNFKEVLDKDLSSKLQPSDLMTTQQFVPIGVGALWLHALKLESTHNEPHSCESCSHNHSSSLDCLESFTVSATESYPFKLDFYFRANKTTTTADSLALILVSNAQKDSLPVMLVRILEIESSLRDALRESPDLFDLPLGYGCQRSPRIDSEFPPLENDLFTNFGPHVMRLDIVAQLPANDSDEIHQWRSHSTSVRLVAGRLKLGFVQQRDYLVLETRDLVPDMRLSGRRATLREVRQVWDLGVAGLSVENFNSTARNRRALYYTLDDRSSKCLSFGESHINSSASIEFPGTGNDGSNNGSLVRGFMLDTALLKMMFGTPEGYHKIRDGLSQNKASFRELVYERRLELLEMRNHRGELMWLGPVSLVRKHLQPPENAWRGGRRDEGLSDASLTIHFLSAKADRLRGKVHLALNERRYINQASFHDELSIDPCFSTEGQKDLQVRVSYPLDGESVAKRLAGCAHCQKMIREQTLSAIYNVSSGLIDPLQVSSINLEVLDSNLLKVAFKFMPRPILLNYRHEEGVKFSSARFKSLLFSELQPTAEGCAESCAHYNCLAFVYCSNTNQCDLMFNTQDGSQQEGTTMTTTITTETSTHCTLFRRRQNSSRTLEPSELVQLMREAIVKTQVDAYNPLGLWIYYIEDSAYKVNQLVPSYVESIGIDNSIQSDEHLLRQEYELILEHSRFKEVAQYPTLFPVPKTSYANYEDCRNLCDQTDCKSFSHCQIDRTCLISQLHDTELIKEHSEHEDYCFMFARDWLSKFGKPIEVQAPLKSNKELRVEEARDCATRCMDERNFKCRSFYHCPQIAAQSVTKINCYLSKRHLSGLQISSADSRQEQQQQNQTCQLYTRSYLAEFDRFYGKSLPEVGFDEENSVVKRGLTAEACALECAEHSSGACQAFHVCRSQTRGAGGVTSGGSRRQEPICVMLMAKKAHQEEKLEWLKPEKLAANVDCSSFIVASESELRLSLDLENLKLENRTEECEPNQAQPPSQADKDSQKLSPAGPLAEVIVLVIGLTLGYSLALVWRRQHRNHHQR